MAATWVWDGGGWRRVRRLHVWDGAAWRRVRRAYVWDGAAWHLAYRGIAIETLTSFADDDGFRTSYYAQYTASSGTARVEWKMISYASGSIVRSGTGYGTSGTTSTYRIGSGGSGVYYRLTPYDATGTAGEVYEGV